MIEACFRAYQRLEEGLLCLDKSISMDVPLLNLFHESGSCEERVGTGSDVFLEDHKGYSMFHGEGRRTIIVYTVYPVAMFLV